MLTSLQKSDIDRPLHLDLLDALSLASSATRPLRKIFIQRDSPSVLPVSLSPLPAEGGAVTRLGVPWLALEARLQQLALEVQERVSLRLETLQEEVKRRSVEVRRARRESERMDRERRDAEERAAQLERQVDISVEMLANLRYELREREQLLQRKQRSVFVCVYMCVLVCICHCVCVLGKCVNWTGMCGTQLSARRAQKFGFSVSLKIFWREQRGRSFSWRTFIYTMMSLPLTDT